MSLGSAISLAVERVVEPVEGMHHAISARCFSAVGSLGEPVQTVHDTVSRLVYQSVRVAGSLIGLGLDRALPAQSPTSDRARAITNGLWGDRLGRHQERLGYEMRLCDATGTAIDVAAELVNPSGHLVFLVHGFADTEACWRGDEEQNGIADRIDACPAMTPLSIRYNTGQRVTANGLQLAELIDDVHTNWPVPIKSISVVGHSMGGLVARSACAHGYESGHRWVADMTQLITLGSPFLGTPLEKLTNATSIGLNVSDKTRPLAKFLDTRSAGIKDLRSGTATTQLPGHVRQQTIAGVVTDSPSHPIGYLFGDLVVRANSAIGQAHLGATDSVVFGGVSHNHLATDARIVDRVFDVLANNV